MSVERFKLQMDAITIAGVGDLPGYWINVAVYDTLHEMRRGMARHAGKSIATVGDVGGCFTYPAYRGGRYLGVLRLSREYLNMETVIHECIHVGAQVGRAFFGVNELRLGASYSGSREELLAYTSSMLAEALIVRFDCAPMHEKEAS